ncbi:hypothetical protein [Aliiruegeria haliotis]|uniref:hypothetical protein n=1 Tax=Aliiruegeria haliotis TaxID=1280846 RepID=UPI0011B28D50|nr:hypothetical protein [Aliiruegeria haliotis]
MLVAMIVAIATPATIALSYYHISGDPTFQPLALTMERLAAKGLETNSMVVRADIHCGVSPDQKRAAHYLGARLHDAFYAKGIEVSILLHQVSGRQGVDVTFHVGDSSFGPYHAADAATGLRLSTEAASLLRQRRDAARPHSW